jgi:hypothetical protein
MKFVRRPGLWETSSLNPLRERLTSRVRPAQFEAAGVYFMALQVFATVIDIKVRDAGGVPSTSIASSRPVEARHELTVLRHLDTTLTI